MGVALSAAQIAQLTSDIVWLVEQSVTLPDAPLGGRQHPESVGVAVYLLPHSGDLQAQGLTLTAGNDVVLAAGRNEQTIESPNTRGQTTFISTC